MPCRVSGCKNHWVWYGSQQVRSLGQSPPERMCDEHLGQLNELGDIDVNCRNPGCTNTWLWKRGAQLAQLAKFGKLKRPARLCDECFASERDAADTEVACKVETCIRTWTWTREAQLRHRLWVRRQRQKALKAAARAEEAVRAAAAKAEAKAAAKVQETSAAESESAEPTVQAQAPEAVTEVKAESAPEVEAVTESSTTEVAAPEPVASSSPAISGEAEVATPEIGQDSEQVAAADASSPEAGEDTSEASADGEVPHKRKRRRRRRRGKKASEEQSAEAPELPAPVEIPEGPPARMCSCCSQKVSKTEVREIPCKVHGCTRTWRWDRASQLRAWAALGTDDLSAEPHPPRRMCDTCRDFCRSHGDLEIPCGRPGCENSWMHKVGAQLQAALAGRTQVPMRLCDECSRGGFIATLQAEGQELPEGAERMPCVVAGCGGSWVWFPGQKVRDERDEAGLELGKMCLSCRHERGVDLDVVEPTSDEPEAEIAGAEDAGAGAEAEAEASAEVSPSGAESSSEDAGAAGAELEDTPTE